jgi:hypothetical protein
MTPEEAFQKWWDGYCLFEREGYSAEEKQDHMQQAFLAGQSFQKEQDKEKRFTMEEITHVFTVGYHMGHELTVEASFLPIVASEYRTFWKEDVEAILEELRKEETKGS